VGKALEVGEGRKWEVSWLALVRFIEEGALMHDAALALLEGHLAAFGLIVF